MKLSTIIIVCTLSFFASIAIIFLGLWALGNAYGNLYHKDELEYRRSKYHTYGKVSVTIDGQNKNVSDIKLQFLDSDRLMETTTIQNGEFKIKTGTYGLHQYRFAVPLSVENTDVNNIAIELDNLNINWWHVTDIDININISTKPELKAKMSGTVDTRYQGGFWRSVFESEEQYISYYNILAARTSNLGSEWVEN